MLSLFFGIVVVLVLFMIVTLVARENQRSAHRNRQSLAYPDVIPAPPKTEVVNGVDTQMMPSHIHNEDVAIETAMTGQPVFSSTIDPRNLSTGTSSPDNGYQGVESKSIKSFADKDA